MKGIATNVTFRGDTQHFSTQKDAYIWLIRSLLEENPHLLKDKRGRVVDYFARSPAGMVDYEHIILPSPHGKWYVNVKLDNQNKLSILRAVAEKVGFVEDRDWSWHSPEGKKRRALRRSAGPIEPIEL